MKQDLSVLKFFFFHLNYIKTSGWHGGVKNVLWTVLALLDGLNDFFFHRLLVNGAVGAGGGCCTVQYGDDGFGKLYKPADKILFWDHLCLLSLSSG